MNATSHDLPAVLADLAPSKTLRVAVNCGNIVLVQTDPVSKEISGIVPSLARELAKRLGVPLELVRYEKAGAVFDSIGAGSWDVCFLAIEPVRAAQIAFTSPYVMIEGTYLVANDSSFSNTSDVDSEGVKIGVSAKSAYDLYLTRTLKQAQIVRFSSLIEAIVQFNAGELHALAGVRQPLDIFAAKMSGVHVLADRFMVINQASGTLPGRPAGHAYLQAFIEDTKASGFVGRTLAASGQGAATVAPAASSVTPG